jgi:hypothetical protein
MDGITSGKEDVALVFDEDAKQLLGIFTESDYIKFSTERAKESNTEEESASFLVQSVKDYVTPAAHLVSLAMSDTASQAIAAMKLAGVRHVVVADTVTKDKRLSEDSTVLGVVNLQDVMSIVQKDERLSLNSLTLKYPSMNPLQQMEAQMRTNANENAKDPETAKKDLIRVITSVFSAATLIAFASQSSWLHDNANIAMIGIFILGYIGIIFEEVFELNKASVALLMSTGLWVTYADFFNNPDGIATPKVVEQLGEQLAEVSDICFFLLAASTIVEVVDMHQGFKVVTNQIRTTSKKELFLDDWFPNVLFVLHPEQPDGDNCHVLTATQARP